MASASASQRLCISCKKAKKELRTLCYECQELLCEPCSNHHLRQENTQNHRLIELFQFVEISFSEDELTFSFLEQVTLTENTILYHGAPAVEENRTEHTKQKHKQINLKPLKPTKYLEFSVKRPGDEEKVDVNGVLCVSQHVVVIDNSNKVLKLFDESGTYISSKELMNYTWGITCVDNSSFATCGVKNTVHLWTVRGKTIVREEVYHMDHWAQSIHYNGTHYCVLHHWGNTITILDRQGRQVKKIIMKEAFGMKFDFGYDIHMDSNTHNIFVPCWNEHGILCMTTEGQVLWFTPLSYTWGITEVQGILCVTGGGCLHVITKEGEYVRKLQDEEDLGFGGSQFVFYGQNSKLYVTYFSSHGKGDMITVYSVSSDTRRCAIA